MTAEPVDAEPIVPNLKTITIDGIRCRVARIRTREVFSLARVLGAGLGEAILNLELDFADKAELRGQIIGVLVLALPGAEEETLAFLKQLLVPVDDNDKGRLAEVMRNPDPNDLLDLVETVVEQEAETLTDLVGKAARLSQKVSQITKKTTGSGDRSPGLSTSSRTTTAGQTTTSLT